MRLSRTGRLSLIALLLAFSLPAAGLAIPKIRDNTGAQVGVVRGIEGPWFYIVLADGGFLVALRVDRSGFQSTDLAYFTTADCTGTSYVFANVREEGRSQIYGRTYVVRRAKSRLWRTRPTNLVVQRNFQSRYRKGGCELFGSMDTDAIATDKYVRSLEDDFPPPYSVAGTP